MTQADRSSAAPSWKPLDPRQRRVLGVLIEKAKTTPGAYPLTLNGIVSGCNQKSNRDPEMALEASDVEQVIEELHTLGAVAEDLASGRVTKYRHRGYEWLGVTKPEIAVMTELLLRGAQTLGDLRGRAARMEPIPDLATLKPIVGALVQRGLMIELTAPGRGQIVSHNLYQERERAELRAQYAGHESPRIADVEVEPSRRSVLASGAAAGDAAGVTAEKFAELSAVVIELRAEVARLRDQVHELESKLASASG
jgi:uncharacterized protein YceH (UPF0502 family)